ncbi:hypothetical protein HHI36_018297 [Cryptolaemus montrouzieri]|uniref:Uncharacterized protein n=1 Tax=Cryptolaemus montrouzieri TaxID=559131 RepID=A0ABD2NZR7_9CUCU
MRMEFLSMSETFSQIKEPIGLWPRCCGLQVHKNRKKERRNQKEPKASGIELSMRMRVELSSVALACDKTGVSDRAASLITSAALKDLDLISEGNNSLTSDRMKIR